MNVIPALYDQLRRRTKHNGVWVRMGDDTMLELTLKLPTIENLRCVILRITQDDNIINLNLFLRTINLLDNTLVHEAFDMLDTDFLDRLIEAINRCIKLYS